MIVSKHGRFVGCETDDACFDSSMPCVVNVFGTLVLDGKSDILGSEQVQVAARLYPEAARAIAVRLCIMDRDSPSALSAT